MPCSPIEATGMCDQRGKDVERAWEFDLSTHQQYHDWGRALGFLYMHLESFQYTLDLLCFGLLFQ